ncbi:acetaldehyde dehydrogenase (acetylating) [Micromonospora carbonacea]|uniref:Acetaldehyde dehydrogenase n=1 Tax=Micromonospora carbonacea TaxID=47853 RepID=A0A1C5AUA2_9ACTN|nr:acetaldehyde dehydrogenase (acetylating) [Micromonospora carbonacea]SCF48604.1 acetaldehyde dehydrogenase [Micromonospora carbonacea]
MPKTKVAIIGSGNIGTDLMIKILRGSETMEVAALVGIDPRSDGLARAARLGVPVVPTGVRGLLDHPDFGDVRIVFDATSAQAHLANDAALRGARLTLVDLTPAAIGPYVVPPVNLDEHLGAPNLNMVTCGGQATIPMVAAISSVATTHYAEIVASISSRSAGPGTRANIDEFTETTARAIERVGGARRGKAIIVLNPAEPPLIMRDTVFCIVDDCDRDAVTAAVLAMVGKVREYVPGYRLKQDVQFRRITAGSPEADLVPHAPPGDRWVVSVFLEVEGAGHYLPTYAGNLDIMTSAARQVGERLATAVTAR